MFGTIFRTIILVFKSVQRLSLRSYISLKINESNIKSYIVFDVEIFFRHAKALKVRKVFNIYKD